jgi:hypothetical protein
MGSADERLRGEVEDDYRREGLDGGIERGGVADVAANVVLRANGSDPTANAGGGEEIGVGAGVKRIAADNGAFGG